MSYRGRMKYLATPSVILILTALQTSCMTTATPLLDQMTNQEVDRILGSNTAYTAHTLFNGTVIIEDTKLREKIAPELRCK